MTLLPHPRRLLPILLLAGTLCVLIGIRLVAEPSALQAVAAALLLACALPLVVLLVVVMIAPRTCALRITPEYMERRILGRREHIALAEIDAIASLDVRSGRIVTPLLAALTGGGDDLRLVCVVTPETTWRIQPRWYGLDHDALSDAIQRALR